MLVQPSSRRACEARSQIWSVNGCMGTRKGHQDGQAQPGAAWKRLEGDYAQRGRAAGSIHERRLISTAHRGRVGSRSQWARGEMTSSGSSRHAKGA